MKFVSIASLEKHKHKLEALDLYATPFGRVFRRMMQAIQPSYVAPYFLQQPIQHELLLCITSDKGLCGPFNHDILKAAERYHEAGLQAGKAIDLLPIGRKGQKVIQQKGWKVVEEHADILQDLSLTRVMHFSAFLEKCFLEGTYQQISILSQAGTSHETLTIAPWLPLAPIPQKPKEAILKVIHEPNEKATLQYILPRLLACNLYEILLRSQIGEHKSRMVAMSQATDSAETLLKAQKAQYNRLRQAMITEGILEIASGLGV